MKRASSSVLLALCTACAGNPGTQEQQVTTPSASDRDASVGDAALITEEPDAGETPDAGSVLPTLPRLVTGLGISKVSVFQAVEVPLVVDGVAVTLRNAPVVAGKPGVVRVAVSPVSGWSARAVTAVLEVTVDGVSTAVTETHTISGASVEGNASSFFTLPITPALGARYRVLLTSEDGEVVADGVSSFARFPLEGGTTSLGVEDDLGGVRLVLVPVQYDTDGSGRLPDTSAAQLERYRTVLQSLYPVSNVEISVRDPLPWSRNPTWTGNFNFGRLNDDLIDLRVADGADDDVYYYGLVAPDDSFDAYCGNSCVTGQSYVVDDPVDADIRVGGGMGFSGEDSAWTLAHELGHMHGRYHAPCDVDDWDEDYPYTDGAIGVWGYDDRTGEYVDPDVATDFMGYCENNWTSDYTYRALFDRVAELNTLVQTLDLPRQAVRILHVDAQGEPWWGARVQVRPRLRAQVAIRFLDGKGAVLAEGSADVLRAAHRGERAVLVPEAPVDADVVEVTLRAGEAPVRAQLQAE
ncbi:MAG: M66 family metalloprotease [Myxococcota bacterium]